MSCIFDEIIDRKNTDSIKYDFAKEYGVDQDVLPLWVADMDFRAPKEVLDGLKHRVEHGVFGYTGTHKDYYLAVADWFEKRFMWRPEQPWFVKTPGVVFAMNHVIRAVTKEGDGVLIQPPVYHPFSASIIRNKRKLVESELRYELGRYEIDFEDFERKIKDNHVKLFILCSPHNPIGRVWTKEELMRIGKICINNGVFIFSDEIHCDFVYPGNTHHVFASLDEAFADSSVVATAPSKTFNLAGLQVSNLFIKNDWLREKVIEQIHITGVDEMNTLGLTACKGAYQHGEQWLMGLLTYVNENLNYIKGFLEKRIPELKVVDPEGTYLLWIDCTGLGMGDKNLVDFMKKEAKLWLNEGSVFGKNSGQFVRLNMGCPKSVIKQALLQLEEAVERTRVTL